MDKTLKFASLLALIAILSACQSSVRTKIETFRGDTTASSGTVYIAPMGGEENDTLEFDFYREKMALKFKSIGLMQSNKNDADYIATLGIGVSRQERDQPRSRVYVSGYWGHYPRTGLVLTDDFGSEYEYVRELRLTLNSNTNPQDKILQINASSEGECEHLSSVYDEMLDAVFANIWRANGSIVQINVKGSAKCS